MSSSLGVSSSSTSLENAGSGKVKAGTIPRHYYYQQATTSSSSNIGTHTNLTFTDKTSLQKNWKQAHAVLPTITTARKNGEIYNGDHSTSDGGKNCGAENGTRRDDDADECRLIIDLDVTTTSSDSLSTSAPQQPPSLSSDLSPGLTLRQQAIQNSTQRRMTATAVSTSNLQYHGDFAQRFDGATNLINLSQQYQLQQQNAALNGANANARIPTPRMQQPAPAAATANPYLSIAALSPYQLLLARAAAAGASAVPNQQTAQLYLPNAAQTASPYSSYMMPNGFSPFCVPLNDAATLAAAIATGQNPAAVAAAIANAGLLVPQTALASAAAAQLLCQQTGAAGIAIQGSQTITGNNGDLRSQKLNQISNYDATRRLSAPDMKNVPRQLMADVNDQQSGGQIETLTNCVAMNTLTPNPVSTTPTVGVLSREAVSEHIKRLISENEAIVEPPPALLKRRSYTKCHQGSASLDYSLTVANANANNTINKAPFGRSNRSQSLIDPPAVAAAVQHHAKQQTVAASGTAATVTVRPGELNSAFSPTAIESSVCKSNVCQFCTVSFRNAASLREHEFRCAQRVENATGSTLASPSMETVSPTVKIESGPSPTLFSTPVSSKCDVTVNLKPGSCTVSSPVVSISSENKHPLKKRILAAAELDAQKFGSLPSTGLERTSGANETSIVGTKNTNDLISAKQSTEPSISTTLQASTSDLKSMASPVQSQIQPARVNQSDTGQHTSVVAKLKTVGNAGSNVSPSQSIRFYPYRLTFKVQADSIAAASPGRSDQMNVQQVTQPTFCCNRKSPIVFSTVIPSECKELSAYAVWPQEIYVTPEDAKLNIQMMGGCNVRARSTGMKYSTATTTMSSLLITQSAYWEQSKKLQRLAAAAIVASSTNAGIRRMNSKDDGGNSKMDETPEADNSDIDSKMDPASDTAITSTKSDDEKWMKCNLSMLSRQKLKDILTSGMVSSMNRGLNRKVTVCNGGYKTNESYTYVRGRGRGRYVCERCGIRCKKPSMLKKHIRTHLNVRPYTCPQCVFSFKTKGNLTKHLKSQAHTKKLASLTNGNREENGNSNDNEMNRFDNDSEDDTEEHDDADGYSTDEDTDENGRCIYEHGDRCTAELRRRRYSYKNIWTNVKDGCYPQRIIRTPPPSPSISNQVYVNFTQLFDRCDTAPPALNTELSGTRQFDGQEMNQDCIDEMVVLSDRKPESSFNEKSSNARCREDEEIESGAGPVGNSISSDTENQAGLSTSSLEPYFLNEGKCQCDICGKTFPKISLLRLHMHVHYFEKPSRRYDYKCTFCYSSFRSRSLLQKHVSTAHQKQIQQSTISEKSIDGGAALDNEKLQGKSINSDQLEHESINSESISITSESIQTQLSPAANPRPFVCTDCEVAFRIHGHLSKHLRSKLHITKLENMGKLPIGLFAKLEDAGNQFLAEIDTSDCANSLISLAKLAEHFKMTDDRIPAKTKSVSTSQTSTIVSLACTEEMLPASPSPNTTTVATGTTSITTNDPTTVIKISPETKPINGIVDRESLVLAADIWVPPVLENVQTTTTVSTSKSKNCNNPSTPCNQQCCSIDVTYQHAEIAELEKSAKSSSTVDLSPTRIQTTVCRFCTFTCSSPLELEIHLHADHVIMKDGDDFRCPRANCDSVYPSQESLRQHLALHFYGKLDTKYVGATSGNAETSACDVSKATVAALSRKLSNTNASMVNGDANDVVPRNEKSHRKTMKTHLVKLSSIPEASSSEQQGQSASVRSNSSSSRGCGAASADNSPSSVAALDSDASRASINSSQSASPVATAESPATMDGSTTGGRCSSGRQSVKRKSVEDVGPNAKKVATLMDQHQQLFQMHPPQALASTPLNGFYQRVPMASSQSPVLFHQSNNGGTSNGLGTPNSGWSASPMLQQQFLNSRQQLSPPQPFYINNGALAYPSYYGVQASLASAIAQQNVAKLLAAGGINAYWNSANAQVLNGSTTTPEAAAILQAAAGLTGLSEAAIGFLLPPQPCILCGKQCANNAQLQEHLLSHSQPRPYVCEHCDAGFTTEQALQSHRPCRQQRIDV